jgi:hypothetical protein
MFSVHVTMTMTCYDFLTLECHKQMSYNIIIIHLNKVLQKFSTAQPSSSVAKHKLLRDTKKQQDVITSNRVIVQKNNKTS